MLPKPEFLQFRSKRDLLKLAISPVVLLLIATTILHIATYPAQVRTEQRVESMRQEFRQWWEYGGKTMLTIQGINPDDPNEYNQRLQTWISQYTDKKLRYKIHLVPNTATASQFFTAWILQPGWLSLALLLFFYPYVGIWLEERWGKVRNLLVFLFSCTLGNVLVYLVAGMLFRKYLDTPLTGTSFGIATAMGALVTTHAKMPVPLGLPNGKQPFFHIPAILFAILWLVLDTIVNYSINPGLYTAAIPIVILMFPLGMFLGFRIPLRAKTAAEIRREQLEISLSSTVDIAEVTRTANRTSLAEGFSAATRREFQHATDWLSKGFSGLLHENPVDEFTIDNAVERMVHPDMLIDISANQWLEWGNMLAKLNLPKSSILCLERNLSLERDEKYARMALLLSGGQRVKFAIDPDKGRKMLEKVISLKPDDLHAKRASDMLARYPGA